MILIDTNALIVLLVGLIDVRQFKTNHATSIYEEEDFQNLVSFIGSLEKLVVLPNVWTELDNILNRFQGELKHQYIVKIIEAMKITSEKFIESIKATECDCFIALGLTDSLLLEYAKKCDYLITSDSNLSDHAKAYGILVYDLVEFRNERLK